MVPRSRQLASRWLLLLVALSAACGGRLAPNTPPARARETEYRGHYTRGSSGSWFTPCGAPAAADSAWWVTATGGAVGQLDAARTSGRLREDAPAYVRWRAVPTRTGEVGPRGPGVPALLVRDVLEVRAPLASDCTGS